MLLLEPLAIRPMLVLKGLLLLLQLLREGLAPLQQGLHAGAFLAPSRRLPEALPALGAGIGLGLRPKRLLRLLQGLLLRLLALLEGTHFAAEGRQKLSPLTPARSGVGVTNRQREQDRHPQKQRPGPSHASFFSAYCPQPHPGDPPKKKAREATPPGPILPQFGSANHLNP